MVKVIPISKISWKIWALERVFILGQIFKRHWWKKVIFLLFFYFLICSPLINSYYSHKNEFIFQDGIYSIVFYHLLNGKLLGRKRKAQMILLRIYDSNLYYFDLYLYYIILIFLILSTVNIKFLCEILAYRYLFQIEKGNKKKLISVIFRTRICQIAF